MSPQLACLLGIAFGAVWSPIVIRYVVFRWLRVHVCHDHPHLACNLGICPIEGLVSSHRHDGRTITFLGLALLLFASIARAQLPPTIRVAVIPIAYAPGDWDPIRTEIAIREAMGEALPIFTNASRGTISFPVLVGAPFQTTKIPGQCFEAGATKAIAASGLVADKWLLLIQDAGCRYGGEAAVGGSVGFVNAGTASYVIAHELGHMLGLNHANSIICILPGNLTVCHFHEYGDPIDVMAGGSTVQARERQWLGFPITFVRHPGGTATYAMTDIEAGGYALNVSRADAISYDVELRDTGFYVRMGYDARMNYVATLRPGPDGINYSSVYRDVTGGVQLTAVDATHLLVERFTPVEPTPDPRPPTPVPTYHEQPTPAPDTDCWVAKPYVKCSPTPTMTAVPTTRPPATATRAPVPQPTWTSVPSPVETSPAAPTVTETPEVKPPPGTRVPPIRITPTPTPGGSKGYSTPIPWIVGALVALGAALAAIFRKKKS